VGLHLAKKGILENIIPAGRPPLKQMVDEQMVDDFMELGGKLWVCTPCIETRQLHKSDLIEGAELMAAATLTEALLQSSAALVF